MVYTAVQPCPSIFVLTGMHACARKDGKVCMYNYVYVCMYEVNNSRGFWMIGLKVYMYPEVYLGGK